MTGQGRAVRQERSVAGLLKEAIAENDLEKVRKIVDAEGFSGMNDRDAELRFTPLHHACYSGGGALVELLLSHGADVSARDKMGGTPLHIACAESYDQGPEDKREVVSHLITHGADVNAQDDNGTAPLHQACFHGEFHLAHFLLDHGADGTLPDSTGETALDIIVENDNDYVVDDKDRQWTLDWYREHHPELVMERYCTQANGPRK